MDTSTRTYTREEVQKYRKSVAQAAADLVEQASPAFGEGDWSWLVDAIKELASNQP
jgi:tRNA 2-selenouridine synthase SelU